MTPEITQALEKIKPTEQRIAGWNQYLPSLFNWEVENLKELSNPSSESPLSKLAQVLIQSPTKEDITKIVDVEKVMSEIKKIAALKKQERLDLTKNLDGVKERLMLIEKSWDALYVQVSQSYIRLKRVVDVEREKQAERARELANFKQRCQSYYDEVVADTNRIIQREITRIYSEALETLELNQVQSFLNDLCTKWTEKAFYPPPYFREERDQNDLEKFEIAKEIWSKWDAPGFSKTFYQILFTTFSDFSSAKTKKEEAIAVRESEQFFEEAQISEQLEVNQALSVIEEKATEIPQSEAIPVTKELKKFWRVEMEHNPETMAIIHKAFYANRPGCLPLYQGGDCWKIDAVTMSNLLAKMKNKDSQFQPDGVVFVEDDKI